MYYGMKFHTQFLLKRMANIQALNVTLKLGGALHVRVSGLGQYVTGKHCAHQLTPLC